MKAPKNQYPFNEREMETPLAILMADLSGYTAMTDIHGAETAISLVERLMGLVSDSLVGESRLHQRIGDQVVIVSPSAEQLAYTATFLFEKVHEEDTFLPMHAGLHYGPLVEKNGSLFGSTINAASRIMSDADKGKIHCSREFLEQLPGGHSFVFRPLGEKKFKNLLQPLEIFELSCCIQYITRVFVIDPVCHMLIKEPAKALSGEQDGRTWYFCSEGCRKIFREMNSPGYKPEKN